MYGYGFGVYFLNQLLHYNVRAGFMVKFEELWGDRYADFELFNSVEKRSCVLGSELWEKILLLI